MSQNEMLELMDTIENEAELQDMIDMYLRTLGVIPQLTF